jgi:basic membrane protein A and related proteins
MRAARRLPVIAFLILVGAFTACSGGGNPCEVPEDRVNENGSSVGVAFDIGGIGDKSFNDAAKRGFDQAVDAGLVREATCIEPNESGSNRDENLLALADDGFDLVIGVGFAFSPAVNENAGNYPDQQFAVIDGYATCPPDVCSDIPNEATPNVIDLTFKEEEGSFLVGVAAALKAQEESCDTVGFLGGQIGFLIGKFEAGYTEGVHAIDPDMTVLVEYIGDSTAAFNDAAAGDQLSTAMYDDGACIIYHAAGASGAGLFTAAVKADQIAIGVDSDQYDLVSAEQKPHVMTSMLKRVDTAVFDAIQAANNDSLEGGSAQVFGIAEEGISYATSNPDLMTQDIVDAVEDYKAQILDGSITVPFCLVKPEMPWCEA